MKSAHATARSIGVIRGEKRRSRLWSPRFRRGHALVEFSLLAALYFTVVLGSIEFAWVGQRRGALINGATQAARRGAVGATTTQMRDAVRTSSQLSVTDATILLRYNSADAGASLPGGQSNNGWVAVTDDPNSGTPPAANAVPVGKPLLVTVSGWRYRLLSGSLFGWLSPDHSGAIPITVNAVTRRE
jgi:Flp pilus assembly protein TadG